MPGPASITIARRVAWMDTDAAGIYHWTTAFRFAEEAEAAMHTALGIVGLTFGRTPRLAVEASFARPLRFNDPVSVRLSVTDVGRTSVRYAFEVSAEDGIAVTGALTCCLVDETLGGAVEWPEDARAALGDGGELTEVAA